MEEDIKILEGLVEGIYEYGFDYDVDGEKHDIIRYEEFKALENLIKGYRELEEENKELKASHIITHNKVSDEEKAKLFDVIDNSIDTFLDKIETKKEQGCKLLECKLVDKNIKLNKEIIDLKHNSIPKSKIKEKIEELDKQRIKMEKDDVGVGFTLGNDWSNLKAKIQVLQELMEDK